MGLGSRPMADADALGRETAEVLARLVRFDTVNPPGDERDCQEWLAGYLRDAGLEVELHGVRPERPNLVARLRGEADGPALGYLSHVDTVLADPADWTHDPWCGEVHDDFLWGRGALDMKSQTAAEAVAAATLARAGWRPPRGELKVISVVDEEVGGAEGAVWLCRERPDLARVDMLLNEGGGQVMPYGDRRLYGVCCAEKGTFRFRVRARGVAGHATLRVTAVPTMISASQKINVIPAHAELLVDARVPPGMEGEATMRRIRELLGDDGLDIDFTEQVVGNGSPPESPLMD